MDEIVKTEERIDDLNLKGIKIIQNPSWFCFGIDAVLLANYVQLKKNSKVVDLGTGTGIIPLILAGKSESCTITAVEIQDEVAGMAKRSVILNRLTNRIDILNADLRQLEDYLPVNHYDAVTSNPPYMHSQGLINPDDKKAISRHEIKCTLEDVIKTASRLLKHHGRFYMVHRPQRLVDIMVLCRKYKLEPKRLQFVHSTNEKKPNLLLIDCKKAAEAELKILDPLIIYEKDRSYTKEIHEIYSRTSVEEGEES